MIIEVLKELLLDHNGLSGNYAEDKQRIYLNLDKAYTVYLQYNDDGKVVIKVFLKAKKYGDSYSKAEWRDCFSYRSKVAAQLNDLSLGIAFNEDGEANHA